MFGEELVSCPLTQTRLQTNDRTSCKTMVYSCPRCLINHLDLIRGRPTLHRICNKCGLWACQMTPEWLQEAKHDDHRREERGDTFQQDGYS